uniref:Uncharacterized protein n=1 Tax=Aegilops tauschii subsp. strangulata TaxID=200361 RepID=A0A453MWL6_AEGTS
VITNHVVVLFRKILNILYNRRLKIIPKLRSMHMYISSVGKLVQLLFIHLF